jgi:hypothetical protein
MWLMLERYVSPALQALDGEAKAAGITVMNEIGVSCMIYILD